MITTDFEKINFQDKYSDRSIKADFICHLTFILLCGSVQRRPSIWKSFVDVNISLKFIVSSGII
jgi:hypothetical protein